MESWIFQINLLDMWQGWPELRNIKKNEIKRDKAKKNMQAHRTLQWVGPILPFF